MVSFLLARGLPGRGHFDAAHLAAGKRRGDADHAQDRENEETGPKGPKERRVLRGGDLHLPDKDGDDERGNAHAQHLPDEPHDRRRRRGHPILLPLHGAHDCAGVGGGEQREAQTAEREDKDDGAKG